MELNSLPGILTGVAFLALMFGFVIYDSALTVGGAIDLVVQNPLVSVPIGLAFLFMVLFGTRGTHQDG